MKRFISKTQRIGEIGETIATKYLQKKGFTILERNFTIKQGEIDIIAKKGDILYFFEVKTSQHGSSFNILENITSYKIEKCKRAIATYCTIRNVPYETPQVFQALHVILDMGTRSAKVRIYDL